MTREVFLAVYHEVRANTPAHWAFYIPDFDGAITGTVYHAVGNPFQGYSFEKKVSYDLSKTKKRYDKISLGSIHDDWVPQLESKAQGVETPGVSKKPLDPWSVGEIH